MNYQFDLVTVACMVWEESSTSWLSDKCKVSTSFIFNLYLLSQCEISMQLVIIITWYILIIYQIAIKIMIKRIKARVTSVLILT